VAESKERKRKREGKGGGRIFDKLEKGGPLLERDLVKRKNAETINHRKKK